MATFTVAVSYSQKQVKFVQIHIQRISDCLKTGTGAFTLRITKKHFSQILGGGGWGVCLVLVLFKYLDFFYF